MELVSIIIPAHNEDSTIAEVVFRCLPFGEVIVVDDGSTDTTRDEALRAGATSVLSLPTNSGYSNALREGYNFCSGEIVALVDADGQQDPDELHRLLRPIVENRADMVIGSKILGSIEYNPKPMNSFMNWTWVNLILWRFGVHITHPFSGMRAMRKSSIDMSALKGDRFESMLELDISFLKNGHTILEVPRTARPRKTGSSHVKLLDGIRVMWRGAQLLL